MENVHKLGHLSIDLHWRSDLVPAYTQVQRQVRKHLNIVLNIPSKVSLPVSSQHIRRSNPAIRSDGVKSVYRTDSTALVRSPCAVTRLARGQEILHRGIPANRTRFPSRALYILPIP